MHIFDFLCAISQGTVLIVEIYKRRFSKRLNDRLIELAVNQKWLVTALIDRDSSLNQSTVSRWMKGHSLPAEDNFGLLCGILEVHPDYFLDDPEGKTQGIPNDLLQSIPKSSDKKIQIIRLILDLDSKKKDH